MHNYVIKFVASHPVVLYRVIIKSFPDYKHSLQENYVEYRLCYCNITINT